LEKKMKKAFASIAFGVTVLFATTFVNAGIIVTDRADTGCGTDRTGIIVTDRASTGIIVTDSAAPGIIVTDLAGIIVTDRAEQACGGDTSRAGILISD
jgi:hypothetical protein